MHRSHEIERRDRRAEHQQRVYRVRRAVGQMRQRCIREGGVRGVGEVQQALIGVAREQTLLRRGLLRGVVHLGAVAAGDQSTGGVERRVVTPEATRRGVGARAREQRDREGDRQRHGDGAGDLGQPRCGERIGRRNSCERGRSGGRRSRCRKRHIVSSAHPPPA